MEKIIFFLKMGLFYIITFIFGNFFPKDKKIVLLGSNNGMQFIGNSRAMYDELASDKDFRVYIVSRDKALVKKLVGEGKRVVANDSLKALWLFLRAKTVGVTHGFADILGSFPAMTQVWIYLGHGIGTKALGYLKEKLTVWEKIRLLFLKKCFFLSTSDFDRYMWCTMYGLNPKKVPITGYPRNDALLKNKTKAGRKVRKVLYAPTYKKGLKGLFPFSDFEVGKLNDFLVEKNLEMYIRLHPAQYKESINLTKDFERSERIIDLNMGVLEDVQDFLPDVDILVTDFSSISRDFLFFDRPMIFILNDIESLGKLALPIKEEFTFCGYKIKSQDELHSALEEIVEGKDRYSEIRRFMRDLSYNDVDANSSKRVINLIKQLS